MLTVCSTFHFAFGIDSRCWNRQGQGKRQKVRETQAFGPIGFLLTHRMSLEILPYEPMMVSWLRCFIPVRLQHIFRYSTVDGKWRRLFLSESLGRHLFNYAYANTTFLRRCLGSTPKGFAHSTAAAGAFIASAGGLVKLSET